MKTSTPFNFSASSRGARLPQFVAISAIAAIAMVSGGCTVGPNFKPPIADAPAAFADWHGGSASLAPAPGTAAGADAAALAGPQDWSMFGDSVLDTLESRALAANQDLQIAALRFAQSRAQRSVVASLQGPRVDGSAAATRLRQSENGETRRLLDAFSPANQDELIQVLSEPHDFYQAGFDASWELDLWGRVRRSIESADADVANARAMLAQVQLSVQAEVARNYFDLRAVQRQIALSRDDIAAADETLELVGARADGGLTTDLDVERQRAQTAELRAQLPQLQAQETQLANRLTLLLGEHPGALQAELAAPARLPLATLPDLSLGLPSSVALRRPDIQAAEAQLHAATANIGVAVGDMYPRITLGAGFSMQSVDAGSFTDWGSRQWSIGPSLQIPIFDSGRRRATVTLRELQQQQAAVSYQQTVLKAWQEIDDALSVYSAERQRNGALVVRERSSRNALELARVRYEHGLTDFLVQLDAQRTWLQAQREYTESSSRLASNLVAVSKSLGGGGKIDSPR